MPEGEAIGEPAVKPYLSKCAGQPLTTGAQAEAYANHYIAVHFEEMSGGRTYAQLSAEPRANPDDAELAGLVATSFKGETLRGLLLNAYAFVTMGQIARYAAIASFVGAGLLLLMSALGLVHARRTDPAAELGSHSRRTDPVLVGLPHGADDREVRAHVVADHGVDRDPRSPPAG